MYVLNQNEKIRYTPANPIFPCKSGYTFHEHVYLMTKNQIRRLYLKYYFTFVKFRAMRSKDANQKLQIKKSAYK